jgi:hypothetical protein
VSIGSARRVDALTVPNAALRFRPAETAGPSIRKPRAVAQGGGGERRRRKSGNPGRWTGARRPQANARGERYTISDGKKHCARAYGGHRHQRRRRPKLWMVYRKAIA